MFKYWKLAIFYVKNPALGEQARKDFLNDEKKYGGGSQVFPGTMPVPNMGVRLSRFFGLFLTKLIQTGTTAQITHRIMRKKYIYYFLAMYYFWHLFAEQKKK